MLNFFSAASQLFVGVNLGALLKHLLCLSAEIVLLFHLSLHEESFLVRLLPRYFALPNRLFLRLVLRLEVHFTLEGSLACPRSKAVTLGAETGRSHVWLVTQERVLVGRFSTVACRSYRLCIIGKKDHRKRFKLAN